MWLLGMLSWHVTAGIFRPRTGRLLCIFCWHSTAKLFTSEACPLLSMLCIKFIICSLGSSSRVESAEDMIPAATASSFKTGIVIQGLMLSWLPCSQDLNLPVPQFCATLLTRAIAWYTLQAKLLTVHKAPL